MRKNFYFMLVAVLSMLWSTPKTFAEWQFVTEDVVPAAQMVPGKMYILESVSNTSAKGHYLTANTDTRWSNIDSATVWIFEEVEDNPVNGAKQYVLRSLLGGWLGGSSTIVSALTQSKDSALHFQLHSSIGADSLYITPKGDSIYFNSSVNGNSAVGWTSNSTTLATLEQGDDGSISRAFLANYWDGATMYWSYRDTNPWDLYEVTYNDDPQADLQAAIELYDAAGYDNYPVSDVQPFAISTAAWSRLKAAYDTAIEEVANEHTAEEFKAYEAALRGAMSSLSNGENMTPMKQGYYYFKTASKPFIRNNKDIRIYQNSSNDTEPMRWNIYPNYPDTTAYIWRVVPGEGEGTYSIQNMATGQYYNNVREVSATPVDYTFTSFGTGMAVIRKTALSNDDYKFLHCSGHSGGSGNSGRMTGWSNDEDPSHWYLVPVTDADLVAKLEAGLAQKVLNTNYAALYNTAVSDSTRAMVRNLIGSVDELYGNNNEKTEGSLANLLDGDLTSYYHSAWSNGSDVDDNYHYLQFNSPSVLPSQVYIYWVKRHSNNNNRPTRLTVTASSDGQTWTLCGDTLRNKVVLDTITGETTGVMPTDANEPTFLSPAISVPAGTTKLRFTVYATNNNRTSPVYKHPYFTFAEFRLYESDDPNHVIESKSQGMRPDMKPAYEALVSGIAYARALQADTIRKVTQEDIDNLQKLVDNFEALWVDSTALMDNVTEAKTLTDNAVLGDEVGQFEQSAVDQLKAAIATAEAAAPYYKLSKVNFDATADALQKAIDAFQGTMVKPADGWYYIVSNVSEENRKPEGEEGAQPTRGQIIYTSGYDTGAGLSWGGLVSESEQNGRAIWAIKSLGDGTFAIQNVAAGWYMGQGGGNSTRILLSDTIVPYNIVSLGSGQIGLRPANGNPTIHAQWANKYLVNWPAGANSASSWTLEPVSETADEVKTLTANRYYVMTVPYNTTELPYTADGEVEFLDIVGVERNEQGLATGIQCTTTTADHLTAGQPVIIKVGAASSEDANTISLNMMIDHETTTLVTEPTAVNGLHGALQTVALKSAGYGYFTANDSIQATLDDATRYISAQEGYIVPQEITQVEGATPTVTIPIVGTGIGTVNAIGKVVADDPNAPVNVYTIDGVLVKKNVKAGKATQGLQKGLYIIGRTKVLVK